MRRESLIKPSLTRFKASFCDSTSTAESWEGVDAMYIPAALFWVADPVEFFFMTAMGTIALTGAILFIFDAVIPWWIIIFMLALDFIGAIALNLLKRCWYLFPNEREEIRRKASIKKKEYLERRKAERDAKLSELYDRETGKRR